MSIETAKADLAKREARISELEAELATERAEAEQIRVFLKLSARYGVSGATQPNNPLNGTNGTAISENDASLIDETLIEVCQGKSIPDAAIAVIRQAGHSLTEDELVDRLRRGGVTLVSDTPALNLRFALLRKRKETGAVKLTDDKRWDVDEAAMAEGETPKQSGFAHNRERNNHAERSRQGLLAARERGVKNGRKPRYTDQQIRDALTVREAGATWKYAAKSIGITVTRLQARIRELKEKESAPPLSR